MLFQYVYSETFVTNNKIVNKVLSLVAVANMFQKTIAVPIIEWEILNICFSFICVIFFICDKLHYSLGDLSGKKIDTKCFLELLESLEKVAQEISSTQVFHIFGFMVNSAFYQVFKNLGDLHYKKK